MCVCVCVHRHETPALFGTLAHCKGNTITLAMTWLPALGALLSILILHCNTMTLPWILSFNSTSNVQRLCDFIGRVASNLSPANHSQQSNECLETPISRDAEIGVRQSRIARNWTQEFQTLSQLFTATPRTPIGGLYRTISYGNIDLTGCSDTSGVWLHTDQPYNNLFRDRISEFLSSTDLQEQENHTPPTPSTPWLTPRIIRNGGMDMTGTSTSSGMTSPETSRSETSYAFSTYTPSEWSRKGDTPISNRTQS